MTLRVAEQASRSDVGRQRSTNEDSFLIDAPTFAVADGMGGARAGEVASGIAVEMLAEPLGDEAPEAWLARIAEAANERIFRMAQEDEERSGMGTTMTAAVVAGGELAVGHVGDSRLYRLRDDDLERLTRDHSLVEELVREGKLAPEDVETHPQRAIITRALGPSPSVEAEIFSVSGRAGDVYLLCSDGLTTMVKEDRIESILKSRNSLEDAATRLVNTANENGGRDNVTVVLFRLGDGDDPPATAVLEEETRADLRVDDVRAAAATAETPPTGAADAPPASAHSAPARTASPITRGVVRRRRMRSTTTVFFVVLSIAVLGAGFWFGTRQFYFVDANPSGAVTLNRGVPWSPLGMDLYETIRTSSASIHALPPRQRAAVLDGSMRSEGDATDLVRNLEEQQAAEAAARAAEEARRSRRDGGQGSGGGDSRRNSGKR